MKRTSMVLALVLVSAIAEAAFRPADKESVRALMVTRGKPITTGYVFVDGKYLPPPYIVQRYGNVLRINQTQVTGPLVSWESFLKTQGDVAAGTNAPAAFEMNPAAKGLVDKMNRARTHVDMELRKGGFYFFSSRYSRASGDSVIAARLMAVLPEALRDAADAAEFSSKMHNAGISFLNEKALADVYAHRIEFPQLVERRRKDRQTEESDKAMREN